MPLKKVTDQNLIKQLESDTTQQPKLKKVTDPQLLKALNTDAGTVGSFAKGFTHTFDEYAASLNKALDWAADKITGKDTKFFEENQKFWNKQKKLNALETYKHPYAKLAGEILLDPLNFTPAGIATKGSKAVRMAKSMAGGAAVGGATMAFKNYGDMSKRDRQKQEEIVTGAGIGAVVNGLIAALTKGKVKQVVHPEANEIETRKVVEALKANPEAFGLTKQQAKVVTDKVDEFWREVIDPNYNPHQSYTPNWRYAVRDGRYPVPAKLEPEIMERHKPAGVLGYTVSNRLPDKNVIYAGWDKAGMLPQPQRPIERYRTTPEHPIDAMIENEARRLIEESKSKKLPNEKETALQDRAITIDEHLTHDDTGVAVKRDEAPEMFDDVTKDPLLQYVLDLARERSYKDLQHPQRLVEKRWVNHHNGGEGWETKVSPALYEKNYDYDFMLTKSDVKKIEKALEKGEPIPDELLTKIENDIGVLLHSPEWSDEAKAIRQEAMEVFSGGNRLDGNFFTNPGINLATGFTAGTMNAADTALEGGSDEDIAQSFINGLIAGIVGIEGLRLLKKTNPKAFEKVKNFVAANYNPDGTPKDEAAILTFLKKRSAGYDSSKIGAFMGETQNVAHDIDFEAFEKFAIKEPGKKDIHSFLLEVKNGVDTPLGKLHIDTDYFVNKMHERDGGRRADILHLIVPTLKEPAYIVMYRDSFNFIKPFIDEKDRVKKFLSVVSDRDGNVKLVTAHKIDNSKLRKILNDGRVIADFVRGAASPALAPRRAGRTAPEAGNPLENIIPQDDDGAQIGAFFGKAPKGAKSAPKEFAPHLKKIVLERVNKEWGDISKTIKGELNRWLTNTLSGEYLKKRDAFMARKNEVTLRAERLHEALKLLPKEDRQKLHEYIVGDIDETKVPEEIKKVGEQIRGTIRELTRQVVEQGILSEDGVKEWGKYYLKRQYEKHFKKLFLEALRERKTVSKIYERGNVKTLKDDNIEALQEFVAPLGIDVAKYNSVREFLEDNWKLLDKKLREGGIRAEELPNGKWRLKRDWTKDERDKMGEIRDAAITVPETILHLGTLAEHARFLDDISKVDGAILTPKDAEKFTKDALREAGYVQLPKSPRYGALSGLWVRKDVRDDIDAIGDNFIDAMLGEKSVIRELWDGYLRLWKKSKTVWNAPAHVNNFLSNLFLMHLSGMNGAQITKRLADATKLLTDGAHFEKLYRKELAGLATKEELEEMRRLNIDLQYYFEARKLGLLSQGQLVDIMKGAVGGNTGKEGLLQKFDNAAMRAYQLEDEVNKLAMYVTLRERGWTPEDARQGVEVVMPDYTQPMPRFWKYARDSGISPFIAWNYYTVPKILRLVRTKEGATKAAIALGTIYGLSYIATGLTPAEHVPGVDTDVPEWAKERYIPIARDGNDVTMIKADRWLPYLQMLHPLNYARDLASGVTTNFMVSTLTGNRLYNNRPIANPKESIGKRVYDTAKFYTQSFVPLPQQLYSTYDLLESIAKGKKRSGDVVQPRSGAQSLAKLLGINTLTYNMGALRREQEKRRR